MQQPYQGPEFLTHLPPDKIESVYDFLNLGELADIVPISETAQECITRRFHEEHTEPNIKRLNDLIKRAIADPSVAVKFNLIHPQKNDRFVASVASTGPRPLDTSFTLQHTSQGGGNQRVTGYYCIVKKIRGGYMITDYTEPDEQEEATRDQIDRLSGPRKRIEAWYPTMHRHTKRRRLHDQSLPWAKRMELLGALTQRRQKKTRH